MKLTVVDRARTKIADNRAARIQQKLKEPVPQRTPEEWRVWMAQQAAEAKKSTISAPPTNSSDG